VKLQGPKTYLTLYFLSVPLSQFTKCSNGEKRDRKKVTGREERLAVN